MESRIISQQLWTRHPTKQVTSCLCCSNGFTKKKEKKTALFFSICPPLYVTNHEPWPTKRRTCVPAIDKNKLKNSVSHTKDEANPNKKPDPMQHFEHRLVLDKKELISLRGVHLTRLSSLWRWCLTPLQSRMSPSGFRAPGSKEGRNSSFSIASLSGNELEVRVQLFFHTGTIGSLLSVEKEREGKRNGWAVKGEEGGTRA